MIVSVSRLRGSVYLLIQLGFIAQAVAATTQPSSQLAQVDRASAALIELMDDPNPQVADAAELALWKLGPDVAASLEQAKADPRAQVSQRAAEILLLVDLGCAFDGPQGIFAQTLKFRRAKTLDTTKWQALDALQRQGDPASRLMLNLLRRENDFNTVSAIYSRFPHRDKYFNALLYADSFTADQQADLETMLQAAAVFEYEADNYVAYAIITGNVKEPRQRWKQWLSKLVDGEGAVPPIEESEYRSKRENAAKMVSALDRADGDLAAASDVAQSEKLDVDGLLEEAGRWKQRAESEDYIGDPSDPNDASFAVPALLRKSLAYRFAGDDTKAADYLQQARRRIKDDKTGEWRFGLWLILSDHPAEGLELLKSADPDAALELLKDRLDFDAALGLQIKDDESAAAELKAKQQALREALGLISPPQTRPSTKPVIAASDLLRKIWWFDEKGKSLLVQAVARLQSKDYAKAASEFDQLWKTDLAKSASGSHDPGALYLRGYCRVRLGMKQQGEQDMLHATICPLSNGNSRMYLTDELLYAGLTDDARRQRQLDVQIGCPGNPASPVQDGFALAVEQNNWKQALAFAKRFDLLLLSANMIGADASFYPLLQWRIHHAQLRIALDAGDFKSVANEIKACDQQQPANVELAVEVVPQLEDHHQQAMADDLFNATYQRWDQATLKYPKAAWLHNNAAWLATKCHRLPDAAVKHARTAVELSANEIYLDTLADAEFAATDRQAAVTAAKQALSAAPGDFFQKRLEHFQTDPLPTMRE
jgi:hypothetical protein